jgi:hypothetical protein
MNTGGWKPKRRGHGNFPDVAKAKKDLATYIMADYSPEWAICKVVADYRLWHWKDCGNAWVDNTMKIYESVRPPHSRHLYI